MYEGLDVDVQDPETKQGKVTLWTVSINAQFV